jgi:hypothetical protein
LAIPSLFLTVANDANLLRRHLLIKTGNIPAKAGYGLYTNLYKTRNICKLHNRLKATAWLNRHETVLYHVEKWTRIWANYDYQVVTAYIAMPGTVPAHCDDQIFQHLACNWYFVC